ncbi:PREDICTED: vacuolar protein sorting-associated protein 51 homolog [Priapulus caudatus]|uniref:Vacuolar protein sorting-associated protein 51 homolog n=1 Tax=Priapulus caudatus TaxID=37621 RepID=A0ABM1E5M4_PRICU|nr:PREDICTED: vacuolar protein sorting-associated protein 51 homolog [Priapulus caudatus]
MENSYDKAGATEETTRRSDRHGMLKSYYGMEKGAMKEAGAQEGVDINGLYFKPDLYIEKLLKEKSLTELMDKESEMVKQIRSLDSDMQTLVYENYNKFISATDTIRKMKNDFKRMEDEMDRLATNMEAITEFSGHISGTLQDRRQQIQKLAGVHALLKKLQFLFELPARLKKCIEMESYAQAVRYYMKAQKVLLQYQHMPSFQGIQEDSDAIVKELKTKLRQCFRNKNSSQQELSECVDLLLQLNEPAGELCDDYLAHSKQMLDEYLSQLEYQVKLNSGEERLKLPSELDRPAEAYMNPPMDILEFVDCGSNVFIGNICLVIASYTDMFINRTTRDEDWDATNEIAHKKLVNFVMTLMDQYFSYVEKRMQLEKETGDNTILVRALDRFHRRLQAMNSLLPDTDFARIGTDIVSRVAHGRVMHYLQALKQHFSDCLTDIRQSLAAPRIVGKPEGAGSNNLSELLMSAEVAVVDQIKSVLSNLQAFIALDITFAMKPYFRNEFCTVEVREGLMVAFLQHIHHTAMEFCDSMSDRGSAPPTLLLLLSRLCIDFENGTISYLVNLVDDQFMLASNQQVTSITSLCHTFKETAQKLLNHYVSMQGLIISQMLRKSVETRDWLNTIEPRNVRAVMKRVVEDITAIDTQVGQLYEEGVRKERSSDSSRRTFGNFSMSRQQQRSQWGRYTPSTIDNSLMSNIQKLFSEKIEIFSTVEFSKVSVLTGIIKISLKTFMECVRLRTFGRYGLQQLQVDTHYLQLYLWRFVTDENLVHFLLDEIVSSAVHRCLNAVMMESSVVDLICDRG